MDGIWGSKWVGLKNFRMFFNSANAWTIISNTLLLSSYQCIVNFILPISLALSLNLIENQKIKRILQTVTYAPHFLSTVVVVGMILIFLSPNNGLIHNIQKVFTHQTIVFMNEPLYFRHIYVWTGAWQNTGWGAIIYLSALAGIDPSLHEASMVDGANRLQRIWHIDLPGILPTATIMLILSVGNIMALGYEKVYLMQNSLNISVSEIISTYVYKRGLLNVQYGFSTAVGLFNSVCNVILLVTVNYAAGKISGNSMF
ncbi:MAG: sugar ABC transporter permease [Dehalococcoidales bacterium]|nr:sugar ABC transporter permease [Dehalococcoidales bacterium]